MKNKILLFLTVFGLFTNQIKAQVIVSGGSSVQTYVQNVLLGAGVTVSNVTINGAAGTTVSAQVKQFSDASSSVGLSAGLILATGDASLAGQNNTSGSQSSGGSSTLPAQDSDLSGIATNDLYDQCILEFDFVPIGDTLSFNYVFASEEYNEYVCSPYNDVFGFFLTGNNPSGGTYNAQNIALVPNQSVPGTFTSTAVAINTINNGSVGSDISASASICSAQDPSWAANNVFYVNHPAASNYAYDGRTVTLPVFALVNCGETYHIKLAIADAGDELWDSGVFLEAGSFSANGSLDATTAVVPSDVFICNAPFNVSFSSGSNPPPNSYWDFGDGIGTSTQQNPTYTYADSGSYTVMFIASSPSPCVLPDTAWFNVTIIKTGEMTATFDIPPYNPCDTNLTINLEYTGTGEDSLYWDLGDGTTFINDTLISHTYTANGDYIVTFIAWEYACGGVTTIYDTIHFNPVNTAVTAVAPPPIVLCSQPYEVNFTGNSPAPPQSYWDFGDSTIVSDTSWILNPSYTYADTGVYNVTYVVIDSNTCNIVDTAYFTVTVNLSDSLSAYFEIPTLDPCTSNLTVQFVNTGSGGDSLYWNMGNGVTFNDIDTVNYTYTVPGTYYVTFQAFDFVCNNTITIVDTVDYNPTYTSINATSPGNILLCSQPYEVNFTGNSPAPPDGSYWDFGDTTIVSDTSWVLNPSYTYADTGVYNVKYVVIDSNTCNIVDTAHFTVTVNLSDSLSADFVIPTLDPCTSNLTVQFVNTGNGDEIHWDMGNGTTFNNVDTVNYTYTVPGTYYVSFQAIDLVCNDTINIVDTVDYNPTYTSINATSPGNIVLCAQPYEVNFTGNTPQPPNSYWDFGDGIGTDTTANPLYTYSNTGTYTVKYVVIDSSTCNIADTVDFTVTIEQKQFNVSFIIPPYDPCSSDSLIVQFDIPGAIADSLYWDMGDGTTYVDSVTFEHTYTPGTYIISLEAYDFLCPSSNATFSDTVFYNPMYTAVNAQPIDSVFSCGSLVVDFTGNTPSPPQNYWDFGDGQNSTLPNPSHTYASEGFYTVTYVAIDTTTCNKYDSLPFTVQLVHAPSVVPTVSFNPPKPCEMDSFAVDLQFTGSGVDSLEWIMGDGTIFTTNSVHYLYSSAGTYNIVLKVYNELCPHDPIPLGEIQFLEISETSGIIPNVFTPNGDDWNDELVFVGIDNTQDYSIRIFDRWGRLKFESTDATKHWDGKDASEGTYFYELRYTDVCSSEEKLKTGTVTLLRGPKK